MILREFMQAIAQEQNGGDARSLGVARDDDVRQQIKLLAGVLAILAFFAFGMVAPQWYFAVIVAGLVLAMLARWPMVGLVAMAVSAPFINVEVHWGNMHMPVVDVVALAMVVAVGIRFFLTRGAARSLDSLRSLGMTGWARGMTKAGAPIFFFAAFLLVAALSLVNAVDGFAGLKYLLRPVLFFAIAYLAVPVVVLGAEAGAEAKLLARSLASGSYRSLASGVHAMLWTFIFVGLAVTAMGLVSLPGQEDVAVRRVLPIAIFGMYPLGTNQNQIAEVLLVTLPVMALLRERARSLRVRRAWLIAMAPVAFTLLATLSRAGWIALAVEVAVVLLLLVRPTKRRLLTGAFVASFFVLPFLGSFVRLAAVEAGQSANENRWLLTTASYEMWQAHPWIGNGIGTFVPLLSQNRRYVAKFGEALDSHGVVQKLLVEIGLLGTALFGLFWVAMLRSFLAALRLRSGNMDRGAALWLALFLGTSVFQLFGTSYFLGRFWLPIGVGLAALGLRNREMATNPTKTRSPDFARDDGTFCSIRRAFVVS